MRKAAGFLLLMFVATFALTRQAAAHQPYFEERDISADFPWYIVDPTISTALYATLESAEDIDYFTFDAVVGQNILVDMTIPQIAGQEEFAPTMVVFGPGLPANGEEVPPIPATVFYEPFSGTSYWDRQERRFQISEAGRFTVAVSHYTGAVGRYVFVVGDREVGGGDSAFAAKIKEYWTPVQQATAPTAVPPTSTPKPTVTPLPSATPAPTATPRPTKTPVPTMSPTAAPPDRLPQQKQPLVPYKRSGCSK